MPRLTPIHWKTLECVFTKFGFCYKRHRDSHRIYEKLGSPRPIVNPTYEQIQVEIIRGPMGTAGMSRKKYFELLEICWDTQLPPVRRV